MGVFKVFSHVLVLFFSTILSSHSTSSSNTITNKCSKNYFMVDNMTHCHPLLTCADLKSVQFLKLIGYGAVKWVFLGKWFETLIVVSVLKTPLYSSDFQEGLDFLMSLNPNRHIIQLVGYCKNSNVIATEYHQLNNANSLRYLLPEKEPSFVFPMKLCLNFVEILNFLHHSPVGVRVNCDSDSVEKILSQMVVTRELKLVLCDVDALPEFSVNVSISCGKNIPQTPTALVPPELTDSNNPGYSSAYSARSDVWKIPDVCNYFFSLASADAISFSLFDITRKCKNEDPLKRPSTREILIMYKQKFEILKSVFSSL